ncbi:hypothetical protein B7463_g84, partial [Scytalidium lignicola]
MATEKGYSEHVHTADLTLENIGQNEDISTAAALATEEEHSLSFWQAVCKYPHAVFWAIAMSFTIVMEGYDTILIGSFFAYPQFKKAYGTWYPDLHDYVISAKWQNAIGAAAASGQVVGLLLNGLVTERFGHRRVIIGYLISLTAFIFIVFFAPNAGVLVVGQVLCGIPWGGLGIIGCDYASEVCPLALRGFLTSFVNICWIIGQLISAGILQGLVDNPTEWSYKIPFAIQWAWPIPLITVAFLAPDSPWWLVRKGRLADAEKSLKRLSHKVPNEEIRHKLAMLVHTNNLEGTLKTKSSYWDCFRGTNLRRTEISLIIMTSQALAGESFAYGSTYFFMQAGLSPDNSYKLNVGGSSLAFVGTVTSWVMANYLGCRTIILGGLSLMSLILLLIGVLAYPAVHSPGATWTQAVLTLVWLGVYSATVGPQSFAIAGAISATRLSGQTISLGRGLYEAVSVVDSVAETYLMNPTAANLKGKTAFVWFATCFCTLLWAIFRLPEVKGLTYEELDILFLRCTPAWKFKSTKINAVQESDQLQETHINKNTNNLEVLSNLSSKKGN